MEDLRTYLFLRPSEQLYSKGMELYRRYCLSTHGQHYEKLSSGPFANNKEVLLECLRQVQQSPPPLAKAAPVITVEVPKANSASPRNLVEIDIALDLRKLRHQRMQASQEFHACDPTPLGDSDRAAICDRIDALSVAIKVEERKMDYAKHHGKLPPETEKITFRPVPDTIPECLKEKNRLSSNILKLEKRIVYLMSLPESNSKRIKQLPTKQEQLSATVAQRTAVRIRIRQLEESNAT